MARIIRNRDRDEAPELPLCPRVPVRDVKFYQTKPSQKRWSVKGRRRMGTFWNNAIWADTSQEAEQIFMETSPHYHVMSVEQAKS